MLSITTYVTLRIRKIIKCEIYFTSLYFSKIRAEAAGVTILNEVGLDPGIDHLLALEVFDDIRQAGGRIESFVSWCGGLPAPESSYNPLRYKFSWSPRGVLLNTLSPAKYFHEGQVIIFDISFILL